MRQRILVTPNSSRPAKYSWLLTPGSWLLFCIFLPLFSGCHLIKRYEGPCAPIPQEWKNEPKEETATPLETCKENLANWWEVFEDPVLNELEENSLNTNNNLWAALERVVQARAIAFEKKSALYPQVNFAPYATRSEMLFLNPITQAIGSTGTGAGSSSSAAAAAGAPAAAATDITSLLSAIPSIFRFRESQYELPLNISYEVDIWNKIHSTYDSAYFRFEASVDDYINVYLTMTADIATNYFVLRDLDAQQVILERTIKARQQAYDINKQRYDNGIISELDVANAAVELARAQADNIDVKRQRSLQENIIATLVGVPASVFSLEFNPLSGIPPVIPTILPSELLVRRPDIAEAERNLAAAYADIEVAYTAFYPSVNLNGTLGFESPVANLLFDWKARLWEVGISALQTVFDGGYNSANLRYYKARFKEVYADYEQAVLTGFKDVEDALVNIREKAAQNEALTRAVESARKALDLSQERYDHGLINYLNVVDAERTLLEVEQNNTIVLGDRYTNTVNLIRALGGSWEQGETKRVEQ